MWSLLMLLMLANGAHSSATRFTNIECKMMDPSYATITECYLKLIGRGIVGLNIYVELNKGPFNNAKVNLSLWRKYNGYRPFMYNTTFDFCKYMAQKNVQLSFVKLFLEALATKSNFNHTCPYDHALIVTNLVFVEDFLTFLPLPTGQYKIQLKAATNNDWKVIIDVHFSRVEDLIKS